ncbi:odorant receptor 46a [Diachasma alloeum]|uniref:Odorant receptor n=1 Tax=Diachasma alloeum TaxID=454923 RepID=A0A4E0S0W4_9HYME|nr:odorant receptor 46a [Diachasma alloeum]THK32910.1 odorant receptor 88 [Diachasma alloeum]
MALLNENFLLLHYFGVWPSAHWRQRTWKTVVYSLYTSYIIFCIYWFTISGSIHLLLITDDVEDFSESSFMLLSLLALCVKVVIALLKKSEIIGLLTDLENYPHKPANLETQLLQDKINEQIRFCTLCYGGLGEATVCYGTIAPFFQSIPFGVLPYKAWIPYDYSKPALYWTTYCQQLSSVFIAANINFGFDTIIFEFIMQMCAQFSMLKYRVEMMINEFDEKQILSVSKINPTLLQSYEEYMTDCVKYHIDILRLCKRINTIFSSIIFVQYTASSIIICVSVVLVSQMPVSSPKFVTVAGYIACIMLEIFLYCAAGNEATFQCQNLMTAIYSTKWYSLSDRMKKCLGFMMARSMKPITFVSHHMIVLSLPSFCVLLKTSYTAYTMLQQFAD